MRQSVVSAFGLLLVACGGAPPPANRTCPEAPCESSLVVPLRTAGAMTPGSYTFHVIFEGRDVECRAAIPLDDPASCGDPRVRLQVEGAPRPVAGQRIAAVRIAGAPREVVVDIRRGVDVVAQVGLRPTWRAPGPDRAGCPFACEHAEVTPLLVR